MATKTVVFISGVSRGIGRSLFEAYLTRPNHLVIGSVRDASKSSAEDLRRIPTAENTHSYLVSIESTSRTDPVRAIAELQRSAGVQHIDVVIANAGWSPDLVPFEEGTIDNMLKAFEINTLGPIILYQAVKPLLDKANQPVWCTVSSAAGSIALMEQYNFPNVTPYGMSKAAVNYFTEALHMANQKLIAFPIHPGHTQSDMGNQGARQLGMVEAPTTLKECVDKTVATIDGASRITTSGKFLDTITGTNLPW